MRKFALAVFCVALSSCGGDSGNNPTSGPAPEPTLAVTLTPSETNQTGTDVNSEATFTLNASYSGSSTDPIVPVIEFDDSFLIQASDIVLDGNTYSVDFDTVDDLAAGTYSSTIRFRLCKQASCATVYPGSTQSFTYTLDVAIANWETRQRNAAHNGYVHASFDPATIELAWQYAPSGASGFSEIAAQDGAVYSTMSASDGSSKVVGIDGTSGAELWRYDLGSIHYGKSGPALSGDKLLIATMISSSSNNSLVVLNANFGAFQRNLTFASQWSRFAQPTAFDNSAYMASGYFGNVVYGWDLETFTQRFQATGSAGDVWDGEAPAVDSKYVYYYSGNLDVIDRITGQTVKTIDDPSWRWNGYSYGGTPMIGSEGSVTAFSGTGQGSYANVAFPLVNFDVEQGTDRWVTTDGYNGIPAVAKGVIYAFSSQTSQLAAIDEETGTINWALPRQGGQAFTGNIIITDNLLFVSGSSSVFAFDLETRQLVWEGATAGHLAITPDGYLVVTSRSLPAVTAYKLDLQ